MNTKRAYLIPVIALSLLAGFFIVGASAQEQSIPKWIKGVAKFWVEGEVSDQEFVQALQWMIDNGILRVSPQTELEKQLEQQILENMLKKQNETPPLIGIGFECVAHITGDPYDLGKTEFIVEVMNHDTKTHSPKIEIQLTDDYERPIITKMIDVGKLESKQTKKVTDFLENTNLAPFCNALVKDVN